MPRHLIPEYATTVMCLDCPKRTRSRWRRFKTTVAIGITAVTTGYAGYCVYEQRIMRFSEIATATRNIIDWIESRKDNDIIVQRELAAVLQALDEFRQERDAARQERETLFEHQQRIERALNGLIYRPTLPPRTRRPDLY